MTINVPVVTKEQEERVEKIVKNHTDLELDELLKQVMRDAGYTKFINYQGEEEAL